MNFYEVIDQIYKIKSRAELEDFLVGITTDKERKEIATRLEIVRRLLSGETQHKIASDLGVGVATVTRGSKELAEGRFKNSTKKIMSKLLLLTSYSQQGAWWRSHEYWEISI